MKEFIIVFRECLEAAIIVGIVLTLLNKLNQKKLQKFAYYGIASAVVLSAFCGLLLQKIESSIGNEAYSKLFEASMMFLASGFLLYMVLWLSKKQSFTADIKNKTQELGQSESGWGVYFLVLFAILREGFETALFLYGGSNTGEFSYLGFVSGILLAVGIAYVMFFTGKKLNLKVFFKYSTILLIVFAAGMMTYGAHEFEEFLEKGHYIEEEFPRAYDILKPTTELSADQNPSMYNFTGGKYVHILHDKGSVGQYLKGFLGYNSNPNWAEVFIWFLTLGFGFFIYRKHL